MDEWEMQASVEGQPMGLGQTTFALAVWVANSPFPLATIIGLDDSTERFSMLYADSRGAFRVYQMGLSDGKIWKGRTGFLPALQGAFIDDGNSVTGRWEVSADGSNWEPDFDVMYTKVR